VLVWTMTADGPGTIGRDLSLESQHPIGVQVADGTYGVVGDAPPDSTIQ
jgi:alpha-L-fucosidase 2